jgi:fused signal recognition particle receptor
MGKLSAFFSKQDQKKLEKGLENTKKSFLSKLGTAIVGKTKIDDDLLDELEDILIQSDVGVTTTLKIIKALEARTAKEKYLGNEDLMQMMQEEILTLLVAPNTNLDQDIQIESKNSPHVVMVVGVNGVGKTTTVGKLAHQYKAVGKSVMLGAADTFRAGAIDQLQIWAERVDVPLVRQEMGSDPASVAFDTLQSAKAQNVDIVFIDTAGRLHNKVNLMNELSKVKRVMEKVIPGAPHEVLLVLDGSTGQNAFEQAKQFTAATEVTSLAITKLDGTAKGGVLLGISDQFQIPVKYIGVGEGIEDLQIFDKQNFIKTLFS